jgi:Cu(I)/Ag(I) efflux system protein CusF
MKMTVYVSVLTTLLLAACTQQAPGGDAGTQGTATDKVPVSGAEHERMASEAKSAPTETQASKTASATGTVESLDAAAGKITIAHGPVDALGWPAMTMGFKATPEQIASVQAGQQVRFDFQVQGREAAITQIAPAQ